MPRKAKIITEEKDKRPYYGPKYIPPGKSRRATETEAKNKKQIKWYGMELVKPETANQLGKSTKQLREELAIITREAKEIAAKERERINNQKNLENEIKYDRDIQKKKDLTKKLNKEFIKKINNPKIRKDNESILKLEKELNEKKKEIIKTKIENEKENNKNMETIKKLKKIENKKTQDSLKAIEIAQEKVKQAKAKINNSANKLPVKSTTKRVRKPTKIQLAKLELLENKRKETNKIMLESLKKSYKLNVENLNDNYKNITDQLKKTSDPQYLEENLEEAMINYGIQLRNLKNMYEKDIITYSK